MKTVELRGAVYFIVAAAIALVVGGLLVLAIGQNPFTVYSQILLGSLGNTRSITNTLVLGSVLLLTGLSTLIPFKARLFNLGIEGQLYMGALAGTYVFTIIGPNGNATILYVAAALAGALWGGIVGVLKVKFDLDEIVLTVFLNYIAMLITSYAVGFGGPLRDTTQAGNQSIPIPEWGRLSLLFGTPLTVATIISLLLAVLIYLFISRTVVGYEIRTLGGNLVAAKYSGIRKGKVIMITMLLSGALSGLAGMILIMGTTRVLILGFSPGYGWVGIAVATMADLNPLVSILTSLFFSILYTGGEFLHVTTQIPLTFVQAIAAVSIITALMKNNITTVLNRSKRAVTRARAISKHIRELLEEKL